MSNPPTDVSKPMEYLGLSGWFMNVVDDAVALESSRHRARNVYNIAAGALPTGAILYLVTEPGWFIPLWLTFNVGALVAAWWVRPPSSKMSVILLEEKASRDALKQNPAGIVVPFPGGDDEQ